MKKISTLSLEGLYLQDNFMESRDNVNLEEFEKFNNSK